MLDLLIKLRKGNGLGQSDSGKLVEKNQRMISKYELEDSELPVSVVKRVAEVFDVD